MEDDVLIKLTKPHGQVNVANDLEERLASERPKEREPFCVSLNNMTVKETQYELNVILKTLLVTDCNWSKSNLATMKMDEIYDF